MPRRTFRRLFERELRLLGRVLLPFRQAAPAPPSRPGATPPVAALGRPARPLIGRRSAGPRPRIRGAGPRRKAAASTWLKAWRSRGPGLTGVALSVALHAILIGFLLTRLLETPPAAEGPRERWIEIRFRPSPLAVADARVPDEQPRPPTDPALPAPARPVPSPSTPANDPPARPETPAAADLAQWSDLRLPPLPVLRPLADAAIGVGAGDSRSAPARAGSAIYAGRGAGRGEALSRFGGSAGTEDAVRRGLEWLARHQDSDGKWDGDGFSRHCTSFTACFGEGHADFDVGLTGLALLAFLGADHVPGADGPFRGQVERAAAFLVRSQDPDGALGPRHDKMFYNHAVATFALVELAGLGASPASGRAAARALAFSARHEQSGGGWDYGAAATGRSDLSITGWQVLALAAARQIGLDTPSGLIERTRAYLDANVAPSGRATYANIGVGAGRGGVAMAAVSMVSRLYLGAASDDTAIRGATSTILRNPPQISGAAEWEDTFQSSYYWYYGTLALFHAGGKPWEAWNVFLQKELLAAQSREPHEDGSWPPDASWVGATGGRIASTALHTLMFEIYYRYPPLHAYRSAKATPRPESRP